VLQKVITVLTDTSISWHQ